MNGQMCPIRSVGEKELPCMKEKCVWWQVGNLKQSSAPGLCIVVLAASKVLKLETWKR